VIEEIWARLRGVQKWPETTATISSVYRYDKPAGRGGTAPAADVTFLYRDGNNELQSGVYTVDDNSSLFNIGENDTFTVRYDPRHPERFWSDEYALTGWQQGYILAAGIVMVVAAIVAWIVLRIPRIG
jgi:hypothetical protein